MYLEGSGNTSRRRVTSSRCESSLFTCCSVPGFAHWPVWSRSTTSTRRIYSRESTRLPSRNLHDSSTAVAMRQSLAVSSRCTAFSLHRSVVGLLGAWRKKTAPPLGSKLEQTCQRKMFKSKSRSESLLVDPRIADVLDCGGFCGVIAYKLRIAEVMLQVSGDK